MYCRNKGIAGGLRECPYCGKPRDQDTKFDRPEKTKYVDEEIANTVNREPDWVCQYCMSLNSASTTICPSCGSKMTSENLNYFENKKLKDSKKSSTNTGESSVEGVSGNMFDNHEGSNDDSSQAGFSQKLKMTYGNLTSSLVESIQEYGKYALVVLSIIAVIVGLILIFIPKNQTITINSMHWERSIAVEHYRTVDESGWSLPSGARLHESKSEIYKYEQILDHYETKTRQILKQRISHYEERVSGYKDLGNGFFEEVTERVPVYETYYETEYYQEPVYRSQPVYKTKYYYEIDKWIYDRSLTTSGFDKSPYWADTSKLNSDERESTRKEKYYIIGTNSKGKSKQIEMYYDEWTDLRVGDTIDIKVYVFGNGELT